MQRDNVIFESRAGQTKPRIKTQYFGGGTPSLYPLEAFKELHELLESYVLFEQDAERTLEVNPGGISPSTLQTWRSVGINRLSIGVQVLDEKVLFSLNRRQKTADVYELMRMVPDYFDNVSVDLIMGLPGVIPKVWQQTLEAAVAWPIKHISIYFLMIHEKTPLYFKVKSGQAKLKTDDEMIETYTSVVSFLKQHGFEQYETSNFARPGFESRHNKSYWARAPYKGFGIGAASFDGTRRFTNEKNLKRYIDYWQENAALKPARSSAKVEILTKNRLFVKQLCLVCVRQKGWT